MSVSYSLFLNSRDTRPMSVDRPSWSDFVSDLTSFSREQRPATASHKTGQTPAISPATYMPGSTRGNDRVTTWGGWFAVDVDNKTDTLSIDDARAMFDGVNHVIYTSTSCSTHREAFRIFVQVDGPVARETVPALWCGVWHLFSGKIDRQCRDLSRLYFVPADWQASAENPDPVVRFHHCSTGIALAAADIISSIPVGTDIPSLTSSAPPLSALPGTSGDVEALIRPAMLSRYNALPQGEHYVGLYGFMVAVAAEAVSRGVSLTAADLVRAARIADHQCPIKTAPGRWSRIAREASRALGFAVANPRQHSNTLMGFFGF